MMPGMLHPTSALAARPPLAARLAQFDALAPGSTTVVRTQSFAVAFTRTQPDTELRASTAGDESFALLLDTAAEVSAGGEALAVPARSVCLLPAGDSRIIAKSAGTIARIFALPCAIATQALNDEDYRTPLPGLRALPEAAPTAARNPRIFDVDQGEQHYFQTAKLMVSWSERTEPRDVSNMSPHSHDDFEQGSLVLAGSYVHHLRTPWAADLRTWQEDQHLACGPSLLVIPPRIIHTSQATGQLNILCDIFAPPREDFIRRGLVANAADYR